MGPDSDISYLALYSSEDDIIGILPEEIYRNSVSQIERLIGKEYTSKTITAEEAKKIDQEIGCKKKWEYNGNLENKVKGLMFRIF